MDVNLPKLANKLAPYLSALLKGTSTTVPAFPNAIDLPEISTPSTPASGYGRLYGSSDGLLHYLNDSGTARAATTVGGARVYNSANLSIGNITFTDLTFNSERFDDASFHSTSSNTGRLTAPVAGTYLVVGGVRFASNTTGIRQVRILLNGATQIQRKQLSAATGLVYTDIVALYRLAANDYVTLNVYQDSGGALDVENEGNWSPEFAIYHLGD